MNDTPKATPATNTLTKREAAELRRLDRKILNGKASRREVLRGFELKRKTVRWQIA